MTARCRSPLRTTAHAQFTLRSKCSDFSCLIEDLAVHPRCYVADCARHILDAVRRPIRDNANLRMNKAENGVGAYRFEALRYQGLREARAMNIGAA